MNVLNQTKSFTITLSVIALGILLTACNDDKKEPIVQDNTNPKIGVWEHKGYGRVFDVTDNKTDLYEFTKNTCIKINAEAQDLQEYIDSIKVATDKKSATHQGKTDVFVTNLTKLDVLPTSCQAAHLLTMATAKPKDVFDHFWSIFNDYYAFFDKRGVDWDQQSANFRSQVLDDMSDRELFSVLAKMLDPIDDGHIKLTSDENDFSPGSNFAYEQLFTEFFNQQTEFTDLQTFTEAQIQDLIALTQSYVSDVKSDGGRDKNSIFWGTISNGEIGIINLPEMVGFSDDYVRGATEDDIDITAEIAALDRVLDRIMVDLKDTRAIIIDIRFNTGGTDILSMMIVNRFADQRRRVLSKYTRDSTTGNTNGVENNTPQVHAYTTPVSNPYTKPVAVLSSRFSFSAAEIFLISMSALPHVTLIGDPSGGGLSDILEKELPNGWEVSLSNEIYLDYLGRNHEVSGVPMDINAPAITPADLVTGKDSAIEAAIQSFGFTSTQ